VRFAWRRAFSYSFYLLGFQRLFIVRAVPEEFVGLAEEEVDLAEDGSLSANPEP
jgi:hypothetical protein